MRVKRPHLFDITLVVALLVLIGVVIALLARTPATPGADTTGPAPVSTAQSADTLTRVSYDLAMSTPGDETTDPDTWDWVLFAPVTYYLDPTGSCVLGDCAPQDLPHAHYQRVNESITVVDQSTLTPVDPIVD